MPTLFRPPRAKKPSPDQIKAFWDIHDGRMERRVPKKTTPRWFDLTGQYTQEPMAVTPTALGVVRNLQTRAGLKAYLKQVAGVNQVARKYAFAHFELVPSQIFSVDRKNCRVLERVHRAPTIYQLLVFRPPTFNSRYGADFFRRLEGQGGTARKMKEDLSQAYHELDKAVYEKIFPFFDFSKSNVLVLNYRPETGKFQFCIIDHYYPPAHSPTK